MGKFFDLVEGYRARFSPHEPSYSKVAEEVGVSRQTLLNWQAPTKLIDKEHMIAVADLTGMPYQRVLDALLEDIGYLRQEQVAVVAARRSGKRKPRGPGEQSAD